MLPRSSRPPVGLRSSTDFSRTSKPLADGADHGKAGLKRRVNRPSLVSCTQKLMALQSSGPASVKVSCTAAAGSEKAASRAASRRGLFIGTSWRAVAPFRTVRDRAAPVGGQRSGPVLGLA